MDMIGGTDHHSIELCLADHLPKITKLPRLGKLLGSLSQLIAIDVTKRGDLFAAHRQHVIATSIANANKPQLQLFVGANGIGRINLAKKPDCGRSGQCLVNKRPTAWLVVTMCGFRYRGHRLNLPHPSQGDRTKRQGEAPAEPVSAPQQELRPPRNFILLKPYRDVLVHIHSFISRNRTRI